MSNSLPASTVTNTQFRADFPAFADPVAYPDGQVTMWLTLASAELDVNRWADYYTLGIELYAAHMLAIDRANNLAAANGGVPGMIVGPATSKGVGGASIGYDTGRATEEGAGFWNQTNYGTRFYRLLKMMGAGGVVVGGGPGPQGPGFGPAWPGPWEA